MHRSVAVSVLLATLMTSCVGVAKKLRSTAVRQGGTSIETIDDPYRRPTLTASEVETRANHIVLEGARHLDKAPTPLSSQALAWRKAVDFATEAITAAREFTQLAAKSDPKPDPATLEALLKRARDRFAAALEERNTAAATELIVYSNNFKVHAGAATIRPYSFTNRNGTRFLESSSETSFYAEVDFLNRTAWLEPRNVSSDLAACRPGECAGTFRRGGLVPQDYEIRMGFINQEKVEGDGPIDSTTEAAGGDWYAEALIGWVLGGSNISNDQSDRDSPLPRGTWGLELIGGFHTDRSGFNTTGYYMAGVGTAWAIPLTVGDNQRLATLAAGLYAGINEYPRVDDDNGIYSTDAIVHFNRLGSFGVKIDFTIPVTNGIEAILQGRHFSPIERNDVADDWSLLVGVSIPIGRLVRDVLK